MKFVKSNIFTFGGIPIIHNYILEKKLIGLNTQHLGKRSGNALYQFSDMILVKIYTCFIGGQCAEDINYINKGLVNMKDYKVSSADTILRLQKQLSCENELVESTSGKQYKFNANEKLNQLLVSIVLFLDLLKPHESYTLDFDHQLMVCQKVEASHSYKMKKGFFPGFATINSLPVFCENRDGNCNVKTNQFRFFLKRNDKTI